MLKLTDIHYHPATSEDEILKEITFEVKKGIPTIISGPSGSGKTTLLEIISGLSSPSKGFTSWKNQKTNKRKRSAITGVVFQFPERHFIGLTILQELCLGHRRLTEEFRNEIMNKVGLESLSLNELPENLSGGQQRRLAIAVQLVREPDILLLDEPTAGLDWSVRDEIVQLINQLSKDQILIVVTHEPQLFASWNVRNYQLLNGRLKAIL